MISGDITRICVNTGNLISCKEFNRRAIQSPSEEVLEGINCTFHSWLKNKSGNEELSSVQFINSQCGSKVDKDDRVNLKLTVKVFLQNFDHEELKQAVCEVMENLDVNFIDSIILALPNVTQACVTLEKIQPLWRVLEEFVMEEKVVTIGVSDLDTRQLISLHGWAQVKPSVNQVNLESCCVMPPEMTAFAKENDIQLLTHTDPKDLLPKEAFESVLGRIVDQANEWKPKWIVRYSIVVKCRGIIQNKGYMMSAIKNIPIN